MYARKRVKAPSKATYIVARWRVDMFCQMGVLFRRDVKNVGRLLSDTEVLYRHARCVAEHDHI